MNTGFFLSLRCPRLMIAFAAICIADAVDLLKRTVLLAEDLGSPTGADGEQAFSGMVELETAYGTQTLQHYDVDRVDVVSPGVLFVFEVRAYEES